MCGRVTMLSFDEVADVVRSIQTSAPFNALPDWPAVPQDRVRHEATPNVRLEVIAPDSSGELRVAERAWGYEVPWQAGLVFNTRIESALKQTGMWTDSIEHRRCLVPVAAFFEPHEHEMGLGARGKRVKRAYRFCDPQGLPLLLAGVWEDERFSIVTTQSNDAVAPVHRRMPLVVPLHAALSWFGSDFAALADCSAVALRAEAAMPAAHDGITRADGAQQRLF